MEGDGFVVGVKPIGSKGGAGSFMDLERFPSSFNFVIAFPVYQELVFPMIDSIFENFLYFSFLLSRGIDSNRFFGGGFRETWKALRSGQR